MNGLFKKEWLEMQRSYRWLVVPLVLIALAVMQPITFHLLPVILENSSLPPGAVLEIPAPKPPEVLAAILENLNQLGLMLLVLVSMGSVVNEKQSGVAASVLVKPAGRGRYLAAKFLVHGLLSLAAIGLAVAIGAFYTAELIGPVDAGAVTKGTLLYAPFLLLVTAVTLFFSTIMPSAVATAGAAVGTLAALSFLPLIHKPLAKGLPGKLTNLASQVFAGQQPENWQLPLLITLGLIGLAWIAAWAALRRQEL